MKTASESYRNYVPLVIRYGSLTHVIWVAKDMKGPSNALMGLPFILHGHLALSMVTWYVK